MLIYKKKKKKGKIFIDNNQRNILIYKNKENIFT